MTGRSPKTRPLSADVLIVGGGPVGGTLACALSAAGMEVIVVDHADPAAGLDAGFDGRASSIALGSQRMLDALGLWAGMEPHAAPIRHIRVSEGESPLFLHYDERDTGGPPFGYMVENRFIRKALFDRIPTLDTVRLLAPARVDGLERSASGVEARLADGRRISARLVVGADGRASGVRAGAGIRVTGWPYRQTAIVCTVAHERPHDSVAREHFLPTGPFAVLPLPGNRSSIVWTESKDLAPAIMALDEDEFLAELERRFGDTLGRLTVVGPRWSYPLSLQHAETAIALRLALVGDAAHAMHPIAGQGLNMGLRDVAALSEVLAEARRLGLDIGADTVLERFQRWRRFDNTLMLAMTDGLNRLFSNTIGPVRLARGLGLAAVNRMPPLKRLFVRSAMGLAGRLPRLMQGAP
ncbi:MAG: 2-octaprenyl-6-methoxyphenyl hydroxylase [Proteobacteria bacterium]|nr:2-octaprenyl-6-methoxyphenyl hydroxylase [Pseudomonadota bacterium]